MDPEMMELVAKVAALEVLISGLTEKYDALVLEHQTLQAAFAEHVESNRTDFGIINELIANDNTRGEVSALRDQVAALQETLESAADEAEEILREEIRAEVEEAVEEKTDEIAEGVTEEIVDEGGAQSVIEAETEAPVIVPAIEEKPAEEKKRRHFVRI